MQNKKVVIFGGMFDPPHIGHALAADDLIRLFPCDEIWIMPSGSRRDKEAKENDEHRWQMTKIFCEDYFSDALIPVIPKKDELEMSPPTHTWATYEMLRDHYPGHDFYFLLGSSLMPHIKEWEFGDRVYNDLNLVVVPEVNSNIDELPPRAILLKGDIVDANISSTFVRKLAADGFSPLPYVLPRVAQYIKKHRLYKKIPH